MTSTEGGMTAFPTVETEGFALRRRIFEQILANSEGRHLTADEATVIRQVLADNKAACIRARIYQAVQAVTKVIAKAIAVYTSQATESAENESDTLVSETETVEVTTDDAMVTQEAPDEDEDVSICTSIDEQVVSLQLRIVESLLAKEGDLTPGERATFEKALDYLNAAAIREEQYQENAIEREEERQYQAKIREEDRQENAEIRESMKQILQDYQETLKCFSKDMGSAVRVVIGVFAGQIKPSATEGISLESDDEDSEEGTSEDNDEGSEEGTTEENDEESEEGTITESDEVSSTLENDEASTEGTTNENDEDLEVD